MNNSKGAATSAAGVFITFEGGEGCGKSTQIELLAEYCARIDLPALILREPGGTVLGEHVRHLLKHTPEAGSICPEAELLLFAASRAQLVRQNILPRLHQNGVVISDRYLDSTTVYQGAGRGLDPAVVAAINGFATAGRLPDLTFLLDIPVDLARQRMLRRPRPVGLAPDRMETESANFYEKIRAAYNQLATAEPHRFITLDATKPPHEIASQIQIALAKRFPSHFPPPQ